MFDLSVSTRSGAASSCGCARKTLIACDIDDTQVDGTVQRISFFAHPKGRWAKKINGKFWYFGKWEDHEEALQSYLDEVEDIQAGRDPHR